MTMAFTGAGKGGMWVGTEMVVKIVRVSSSRLLEFRV